MTTETLYATSLTAGTVSTSGNALGAPNGTFTTDADNVSWTARFAMGNPVGNTANGTHTITLRVRKETGNGTPSVASITLYAGATSLGTIGAGSWSVTSTTGQDITATFADTVIDGFDLSTIEVEIATNGVGGSGSNRTCVQLDGITWSGDFTTVSAPNTGAATGAVSWTGVASGARVSSGAVSGALTYAGTATGATPHAGSATGSVAWSGSATGVAPTSIKQGSASGAVSWAGVATGARPSTGSAVGSVAWVGAAAGARASTGLAPGGVIYVGTATGARPSTGAATGTLTYTGTATGTAPTTSSTSGEAAGSVTWTGTATGTATTGAARWRLVRPGAWDYATLGFIASNGDILVGDQPDAHWVPAEDQNAAEDVTRYSYCLELAAR